ncbi:hypothetical protein AB0B63_05910 [Micromonospora sp. NPDC049081]|uniref:hypothetical protein n=1 Tax=Micromonospora sp. NPDC049081 TaxID=3155150 RepID=UPI0033FB783A
MGMFGYRITQLVGHLPVLVTLLVVLVLAATARRRLPGRARSLLIAGAAVLLLVELFNTAWVAALPELIRARVRSGGMRQFELMNLAASTVSWIGYPIGLGLVVAAVFAGRAASHAPGQPWGAWTPPAGSAAGQPSGFAAGHPGIGHSTSGHPATGQPGPGPVVPGQAAPWGGSDRPPAAPPQGDRVD